MEIKHEDNQKNSSFYIESEGKLGTKMIYINMEAPK